MLKTTSLFCAKLTIILNHDFPVFPFVMLRYETARNAADVEFCDEGSRDVDFQIITKHRCKNVEKRIKNIKK